MAGDDRPAALDLPTADSLADAVQQVTADAQQRDQAAERDAERLRAELEGEPIGSWGYTVLERDGSGGLIVLDDVCTRAEAEDEMRKLERTAHPDRRYVLVRVVEVTD